MVDDIDDRITAAYQRGLADGRRQGIVETLRAMTNAAERDAQGLSIDTAECKRDVKRAFDAGHDDHDWEQTAWEYDFAAFRCRRCHRETHCGRGTPARTFEECVEHGIPACLAR